MRKKPAFLIWSMIVVLLLGSIKNSLILNFYLLDNKDFTELFCVNKDKPQIHCNGNCQLSKMADKENKDELPAIFQQLRTELVFFADSFSFEFPTITETTKHNFYYLNTYKSAELKLLNPPPVFG